MPASEAVDSKNLLTAVNKTAKQIRFAGILTLTRLAVQGQKDVKVSLDKEFTLKNKWTASGIRIKPAMKNDRPEPYAEVFSRDWYIAQHEEGVKRSVPDDEGTFFIPGHQFEELVGINPEKQLIPKKYRPDRIFKQRLDGSKPFKIKIKSSGQEAIAVRNFKRRVRSNPGRTRRELRHGREASERTAAFRSRLLVFSMFWRMSL